MDYVLDRPDIRPTPLMLEDDYAKWCGATNRYWLKLLPETEREKGTCPVFGCGLPSKSGKCHACRKYICYLNNPAQQDLQALRSAGRKKDFDVTAEDLYDILRQKDLWEKYMTDPSRFKFSRVDAAEGFYPQNIQVHEIHP